ncbi:MAG: hypothetical protein GX335_08945 [Firmicutes bacterium]|nr:hypothetical protein [Bacillota bacterium]
MKKRNPAFCLIIASLLLVLVISWCGSAQENQKTAATTTGGALNFLLSGYPGVFRENTIAYYSVQSKQRLTLQFSASPLTYLGQEEAALDDVYYWINNNPNLSFRPGKSLVLDEKPGEYEFSIHGKVTIKALEAQPTGKYKGTIYVTAFPAE